MTNNSDCMVLHIEEYEVPNDKLDHSLFILYDSLDRHYIIRGKRRDPSKTISQPYSFNCVNDSDLVSFIQHITDPCNNLRITLYNYDNLPSDNFDITYEFLSNYVDISYEIVGFNNNVYKRKELLHIVKLLRTIYNSY